MCVCVCVCNVGLLFSFLWFTVIVVVFRLCGVSAWITVVYVFGVDHCSLCLNSVQRVGLCFGVLDVRALQECYCYN